ncbi:MAG: PEP/pyruvate-binding domain-containing protein, partial [Thermoplasmatota archaeon]
ITALQMDIKIKGLSYDILSQALAQARDGRLHILNKMSETMLQELRDFFTDHLGFGSFVFRTPEGREVGRASDIHEFIEVLKTVPAESINYHGRANQFSNWLMARGELELARELRPKKVTDFKDWEDIRTHLLNAVTELRRRKQEGVITDFSKQNFEFEGSVTRLGGGSLGGKGRGIAFLSVLLHRSNLERKIKGCRIRIPDTLIIGTDEFDRFMRENNLTDTAFEDLSDLEKKKIFLKGQINQELKESLSKYLSYVNDPIAVRSSSLLEDSQNQPFAGIYSTYILPNNCDDDYIRLELLCDAIKLVYASTFFDSARSYIQTTIHVPEEEKMGIVLQKLVGNQYRDRFYPIFSGVAQSYNYYPLTPLKREDGIVSIALGLGKIVVEGENVLSFSPEHPNLVHGLSTVEEILKNSQNHFYALNMSDQRFQLIHGEDETLRTLSIQDAENDDTLVYSASTYDHNDNRIRDGVGYPGPKIINFAGILKYNMIPLVPLLKEVLRIGKKGMGGHIEIEFAGRMGEDDVPVLYVVQIRPLVTLRERKQVVIEDVEMSSSIIHTDHALGNGVIERIYDVVAVPPDTFDSLKTVEIAKEIGRINRTLAGKPYLLIGPGRWGTQDRFLGIPVKWAQISNARCIVETSLENFNTDPSHGTHFFHNLTSMGMHYFTIRHNDPKQRIDWDWIMSQQSFTEGEFVRHFRLTTPLSIKVDGRTGKGMIRLSPAE